MTPVRTGSPGETDPPARSPFNDPRVLPQTWYPIARSRDVPAGRAVSRTLLDRPVAVYRGTEGRVRALAGPCPHLGADLGLGRVTGDALRCSFHHWTFSGDGRCVAIPAEAEIPDWARTFAYPVEERYGTIWLFNGPEPLFPVPTFSGFDEPDLLVGRYPSAVLGCHPHVLILNGLDLQHFRTVHRFDLAGEPVLEVPDRFRVRVRLALRLTGRSLLVVALRALAGRELAASFCTWGGNMATIEARAGRLEFFVLFSYVPLPDSRSRSNTLVLVPRSAGAARALALDRLLLLTVQALVAVLLLEDRRLLDALRFHPHLVPSDAGLAAFMHQVQSLPVFDPPRAHADGCPALSRETCGTARSRSQG
jgi:phenylpropionate dioxygenase-like ring-hydroxylating dioxygenase large terminal subunit